MPRAALLLGVVALAGCNGFTTHDHEYDFPAPTPYAAPPASTTNVGQPKPVTPIYKGDPYGLQTGMNLYNQLVAGDHYTCGIVAGTLEVVCWGDVLDGAPAKLREISAGPKTACGVRPDETITCWGAAGGFEAPANVKLTKIGVGDGFACALDPEGHAHCWGPNAIQSPTEWTFEKLSVGADHACGIDDKGQAHCWANGEVALPWAANYFEIATGTASACAIRVGTRAVDCWGLLPGRMGTFTGVAVGDGTACAIRAIDGRAECWSLPELDTDRYDTYVGAAWLRPPEVALSSITIGASHACGIRRDNQLAICWGSNVSGESRPL